MGSGATGAIRAARLLVVPTLAACLLCLEAGLRLQGRLPSNVSDGIFTPHGEGYRLQPNRTKLSRTPAYVCTIHTNGLGLRDLAPGPRRLERPYLAWLGDSATFANGVDYQASFVGRFGELAAPAGLEVANLAVGGHHLDEQEDALLDLLAVAPRPPEAVVVVFTPQMLALFDQHHQDLFELHGYLYPRRRWIRPWLSNTLGETSAAYAFLRDGVRRVQGRLLPGQTGRVARDLLEIHARSHPAATPAATARLEARLDELDARIRANGAAPVHVYLPTTAELRAGELLRLAALPARSYDLTHWRTVLRRQSRARGVPFVDLTAPLEAEAARGAQLGFSHDMHFNASAHRLIAAELHRAILPIALRRAAPLATSP